MWAEKVEKNSRCAALRFSNDGEPVRKRQRQSGNTQLHAYTNALEMIVSSKISTVELNIVSHEKSLFNRDGTRDCGKAGIGNNADPDSIVLQW